MHLTKMPTVTLYTLFIFCRAINYSKIPFAGLVSSVNGTSKPLSIIQNIASKRAALLALVCDV